MDRSPGLLIDGLVAVGWGAVVASYEDIQTLGDWTAVIGVTLLAGVLSGRYRILIMALIAVIVVAAILAPGSSNDPSLREDAPLYVKVLLIAWLTALFAAVMAFGVFLRRRWMRNRDSGGPWDLSQRSEP